MPARTEAQKNVRYINVVGRDERLTERISLEIATGVKIKLRGDGRIFGDGTRKKARHPGGGNGVRNQCAGALCAAPGQAPGGRGTLAGGF